MKAEIERISPQTAVHLQKVDVGNEADVMALYDAVKTKFGGVDVVVSNAAAQSEFGVMLPDTDTEKWWSDFVGRF